jgi:alkyl hydroperoxide reductase subunit D
MSIEQLKAALPDYAKDTKLNIGAVLTQPVISAKVTWGTALACAIAARNPQVIAAVAAEAATHLDAAEVAAAKIAASIMAMNNIYYRFVHLSPTADFGTMRAGLRMNGIAGHGTDPVAFELVSLAVSTINGCGKCIEAHEHEVYKKGATKEQVQAVVKIAAVIHALAVTLEATDVLKDGPAA